MISTTTKTKLPELLAPAGNWECAKAAVENGADAIYFGLDKFNSEYPDFSPGTDRSTAIPQNYHFGRC